MTNLIPQYWHIQHADKPLFPELIWSKPEGKNAGKLLIIGGNSGSFRAPADAYNEAIRAGIGSVRVILPASLQKTVGKHIEAEFAPANPSGSFSQQALAVWLENAAWADGVLLAGDYGRNSETAVLLEKFITKTSRTITLTQDGLEPFLIFGDSLLQRSDITIVPTISQLQKLCKNIRFPLAITSTMSLMQLVEALHQLTTGYAINIVMTHQENIVVAVNRQVSSTKNINQNEVLLASKCAVWLLQNPLKPFATLTTAILDFDKS